MRLLSVPIGIAALLVALAVGLVAGLWGRGGPTTDRLLTQAASLSAGRDASNADEIGCACSLTAKLATPSRRLAFWLAGATGSRGRSRIAC